MDSRKAEAMLSALGSALDEQGSSPVDVVVCGAMALLMRGIIDRPTRDIDGLGLVVEKDGKPVLVKPHLSDEFRTAVARVGSLYGEGRHNRYCQFWYITSKFPIRRGKALVQHCRHGPSRRYAVARGYHRKGGSEEIWPQADGTTLLPPPPGLPEDVGGSEQGGAGHRGPG